MAAQTKELNPNIMSGIEDIQFGVEFEFLYNPIKLNAFLKSNNIKVVDTLYGDFDEDNDKNEDDEYYSVNVTQKILNKIGLSTWKAKDDPSVEDEKGNGYYGVEVATPPLKGFKGIQDIIKFCTIFSKIGYTNETCGLHVHVDANDWIHENLPKEELTNKIIALLLKFRTSEALFDKQVTSLRRGKGTEAAKETDAEDVLLKKYEEIKKTDRIKRLNQIVDYIQSDRRKKINIQSLLKYGTIEFRQLEGTLDAKKVYSWVVLCVSFLNHAKQATDGYVEIIKNLQLSNNEKNINKVEIPEIVIQNPTTEEVVSLANKLSSSVNTENDLNKLILHFFNSSFATPKRSIKEIEKECLEIINEVLTNPKSEPQGIEEAKAWQAVYNESGIVGIIQNQFLVKANETLIKRLKEQDNRFLSIFVNFLPSKVIISLNNFNKEKSNKIRSLQISYAASVRGLLTKSMFQFSGKQSDVQIDIYPQPLWYNQLLLIVLKKQKEKFSKELKSKSLENLKQIISPEAQGNIDIK